MAKKQFKTESKKLLDMMINSIYTHKEIFLRELISNASDALDKLRFKSLTDSAIEYGELSIHLRADKEARTLTVSDNGCGMTAEEMETNLGTIAKSGSFDFKREGLGGDEVDIIGQFGVGFYSAFMVAKKIRVLSRPYGAEMGAEWISEGADGYTIRECEKRDFGTEITLYIKEDSEEESYGEFLEEYRLRGLVKKYSDYIRYPIKMNVTKERPVGEEKDKYETYTETEVLNSMVPIWKKNASEVTAEEYNSFYTDKFFDYQKPLKVITQKSEGTATYTALLFLPSHAPYNYYTKDYEKGLELYSSGVLIMEKCQDLLPDYFGFVKGLVDSQDLSLNISREMLQHDRQLKVMAKAIEKKIKSELLKMLESNRESYEKLFEAFGLQLKYGLYSDYGMHKDVLVDLVMFPSSSEKRLVTFKEYTSRMKAEQKTIFYAAAESVKKAEMLPQVEAVTAKGYEVLYLTDDVDEFAVKMLGKYGEYEFKNVTTDALDLATEEEKEILAEENKSAEELFALMKEALGDKVDGIEFTSSLKDHPVCLSSEGELSLEMEKVLSKMPGAPEGTRASVKLLINREHEIKSVLESLVKSNGERVKSYAKILYNQARLVAGLSVENPVEFSALIAALMCQ